MTNQTDSHIKIIKDRFFTELWNKKNLATAENIFTDDFITESIALEPSDWVSMHGIGPNSMKHHIKWWLEIMDGPLLLMEMNKWITIRIEVKDEQAKLFPNNNEQPSLIVNDLKHGANLSYAIGLWVEVGTEGFFFDLIIRREE